MTLWLHLDVPAVKLFGCIDRNEARFRTFSVCCHNLWNIESNRLVSATSGFQPSNFQELHNDFDKRLPVSDDPDKGKVKSGCRGPEISCYVERMYLREVTVS